MADGYELVQPFDIDGDELDGLSPQMCFALGVEWQMVRHSANADEPFEMTVHVENKERLTNMLDRMGRTHGWQFMPSDRSESWVILSVYKK